MLANILYYGFHSFINQIRKLLKTWFLLFLVVCMLLGGIIGYTAARIENSVEYKDTTSEIIVDDDLPVVQEINSHEAFKLVVGGIFTILFVIVILSSLDNGLNIFLPADVNIMFTSPMSPQSVLMFRVLCKMGLYLFFSIYFMIEVPALKELFELTSFQSAMLVISFVITLASATLVSIYLSLLSTKNEKYKSIIKYLTLGLIGVFLFTFVVYWKASNNELIEAAINYFNSDYIYFIPVIGWLKGMSAFVVEGKVLYSIICLVLVLIFNVLIIFLIKNIKVDFYEEAMQKSEEIRQLMAKTKEKGSIFVRKKKSGKEEVLINELNYGNASSMFLVKSLYNRFRFAKFHVFTKTLITYLFVAIITSLIVLKANIRIIYIPAAVICIFVFFRTMGNPLREDIENIYFLLAPQSAISKLFYSMLAGSINCLLDALPGLIISAIILKASVIEVIGCLGFMISLDFFSTSIGSFVNLSLPKNVGTTLKQLLQIMFIYFGLVPDILILVLGIVNGYKLESVILLTAIVNIVIGLVFMALAVPLIEPRGGIIVFNGNPNVDLKEAKKTFSTVGFMDVACYLIMFIVQIGIVKFIEYIIPSFELKGIWMFFISSTLYFVAMPLAYILIKNKEKRVPLKESMKISNFIKFIPVICFLALVGSLLGNILSMFFSTLANQDFINPVSTILDGQNIIVQIIFVVIVGPFFEELFFRKITIDHLNIYGEKLAIILSAILFGLFHGNIAQAIYAILLGLVLGYVYVRTGSLKYSFILHAFLNLFNGILPSYLLSKIDLSSLDSIVSAIPLAIYYLIDIILAIIGLIIICIESRNLIFKEADKEIVQKERFNVAFINPGIILFIFLVIVEIVNGYIGLISGI